MAPALAVPTQLGANPFRHPHHRSASDGIEAPASTPPMRVHLDQQEAHATPARAARGPR